MPSKQPQAHDTTKWRKSIKTNRTEQSKTFLEIEIPCVPYTFIALWPEWVESLFMPNDDNGERRKNNNNSTKIKSNKNEHTSTHFRFCQANTHTHTDGIVYRRNLHAENEWRDMNKCAVLWEQVCVCVCVCGADSFFFSFGTFIWNVNKMGTIAAPLLLKSRHWLFTVQHNSL